MELYQSLTSDSSTPSIGLLHLHVATGHYHMTQARTAEGLLILSRALEIEPANPVARHAHYWMCMACWRAGDIAKAKDHALRVRVAPWSGSGFAEDWRMAAHAEWILADNNPANLDARMVAKYGSQFMEKNRPQ